MSYLRQILCHMLAYRIGRRRGHRCRQIERPQRFRFEAHEQQLDAHATEGVVGDI